MLHTWGGGNARNALKYSVHKGIICCRGCAFSIGFDYVLYLYFVFFLYKNAKHPLVPAAQSLSKYLCHI